MKRLLWGAFFVALGAGVWWIASQTARFSVKKWDATIETAVKHAMTTIGVQDNDVLSSVHEIRKDKKGEWVVHQMAIRHKDSAAIDELSRHLESAGARVEKLQVDGKTVLMVRRGSRLYQQIEIQPR